ncbi:hypothetical protein PUR71_13900 [Streptomyces sp. SP17BM10]|nr:hypothetical protein [Streptomyces sp. SP17BM10]MEE1783989.1 hypothetical protein [Streptomyces sp. SP17BM10]
MGEATASARAGVNATAAPATSATAAIHPDNIRQYGELEKFSLI